VLSTNMAKKRFSGLCRGRGFSRDLVMLMMRPDACLCQRETFHCYQQKRTAESTGTYSQQAFLFGANHT
jgi:hypothetical protein